MRSGQFIKSSVAFYFLDNILSLIIFERAKFNIILFGNSGPLSENYKKKCVQIVDRQMCIAYYFKVKSKGSANSFAQPQ